jgi:methylthioribose-1-phosphate isomerase
MKLEGSWRRAIELADDGRTVRVLDQQRLPYEIAWVPLATVDDAATAIRDMTIRGAPLIGAVAAYGVALAVAANPDALSAACELLAATRPTAVNLRWALAEMTAALAGVARSERAAAAYARAAKICDDDVAICQAIGGHGLPLIRDAAARRSGPVNVLTHCNAGWLATVDWGTALAPIYRAHEEGIAVHVWVDETRPRNQGLLTAWELAQHGVPHTLIADNAGGHLMQRGQIDLCIVGTDRTTRSGDVCNKIGTYLKALAARESRIPFYVAAPSPSIDWTITNGADIPIEERCGDEVRFVRGIEVVPAATPVANPAFDVTPAALVTGIITERGIVAPAALAELFGQS